MGVLPPFLLKYCLWKDSRRGISISSCAPKGKPIEFQRLALQMASSTYGHTDSRIKLSGSQKKTRDVNVGKGLEGRGLTGVGLRVIIKCFIDV